MTTIAWDGQKLAGDTQGNCYGMKARAEKVFRLHDGRLYGGSGEYQHVLAARDWLNGGDRPKFESDDSFAALLVSLDGSCSRLEKCLVEMPVYESFAACGSGMDFATAAMHFGKSAREAVEVACALDVNTGGDVLVLELDES